MSGLTYCLIAVKTDVVLCEYTASSGNFEQFARILLNKEIEPNSSKILYNHTQNYKFYYINENGVTFLCMGQDSEDSTAFSFLNDIKSALYRKFEHSSIISAKAYEFEEFKTELKKIIDYYDGAPRKSIGGDVIKTLSEAKKVMSKNIQELMEREGNILITVQSAQTLSKTAENLNLYVSKFKQTIPRQIP